MSERYSKLFSLPENLYAEGAPVIVSAGNLLKDNQTGKVLAQLKIKNIAAEPLKAATVLIHPLDAAGKPMTGDTEQKYLDLTAKTGEEFGQKTAVFLPDDSTRGFSVEVTQAVFADNSTWDGTAAPWEPLPPAESLSSKLGDAELLKQYRIKFGGRCEAVSQVNRDLWRCACGAWNRGEKCYSCGKEKDSQILLEIDALKAERDARLAKEKAEREAKEAADKAAAEANAKKTKKLLSILIPAVVVCVAALLIFKVFIPNSKYNKAVTLLDAGQYEEAIIAFEELNGYKDSAERITAAKNAAAYAEAETLLEAGQYEEAIAAFEALNGYNDSAERIDAAREAQIEAENAAAYAEAEALLEAEKYDEAIAAFEALGSYRDSAEQLARTWEAKNAAAYAEAEALLAEGKRYEAALTFYQIKGYNDSWDRCFALWGELTNRQTVAAGNWHAIGIQSNGDLLVVGKSDYSGGVKKGRCDVDDWIDLAAVSVSDYHTVGLQYSGHVLAVGTNIAGIPEGGRCDVGDWTDMVSISAGLYRTFGIRADGVLFQTGVGETEIKDVIQVSQGNKHSVLLLADGSVYAIGNNEYQQCDVSEWTDIVAVAAGSLHTVGLRSDGTVVATGRNDDGECNVSNWANIHSLFTNGNDVTFGITADGTVVLTGAPSSDIAKMNNWKNIS